MPTVIAFISQKGGVGKSTLARALAREAAAGGLSVKIADLDTQQGTSVDWHRQRLDSAIEPTVAVEAFKTAEQALAVANAYDLLIVDGPARTSKATLESPAWQILSCSRQAHRPTTCGRQFGNSTRWCRPVSLSRSSCFALNRIGTDSEEAETRSYIAEAGYDALPGCLPERPAYRQAQNLGFAVTETRFSKLNERANALIQALIDRIASDG